MDDSLKILQRILIFFPLLFLFYYSITNSIKLAGLNKNFKVLVIILFTIQIITHIVLLLTKKCCTPKCDTICNKFAFVIGIIYMYIVIKCFKSKRYNIFTFISLIITIYIIISHLVTIYLIKGTFVYKNIELPIFSIKSYILIISDLFHENKLKEEIKKLVKVGEAIVDAGAYIGDTTILLASEHSNSFFYAIEPSLKNHNFIKKVKDINNLKNLTCLNLILSNEETLYSNTKNGDDPNAQYTKDVTGIKSETLDLLVSKGIIKEKICLLHYDVEGMELEVLQGSEQTIKNQQPVIIVEMLNNKQKNDIIIDYLKNLNYNYRIINESCCFGDFNDSKKCRNYIFQINK